MTGVLCAIAGSGIGALDAQTVTTGASGTAGAQDRIRGYSTLSGVGSITDGTSNVYAGAAITELYWYENTGAPYYYMAITGAANSGWTSVIINGTKTLDRASATFSSGTWNWATSDTAGSQAFNGAGATIPVWFV